MIIKFFFDGNFDFNPFRMAFCPNESGIDNFSFVEPFDFF
jgi:hypothetical protein